MVNNRTYRNEYQQSSYIIGIRGENFERISKRIDWTVCLCTVMSENFSNEEPIEDYYLSVCVSVQIRLCEIMWCRKTC